MKKQLAVTLTALTIFFACVSPVLAANSLPTVNTFALASTAVSPVPVTAFTASDKDGTVVGYMITDSNTKPAASDTRWTATSWTQFTTTKIGALTLYAWAKDNAGGVSSSKTAATNVVGTHVHDMSGVAGLAAALAEKASKYANVVVVAKSGGDFDDPIAAINSITDASATNPYLLKIMPGVYDLGSKSLDLKEYVDLEGSGEKVTVITSSLGNPDTVPQGTVNGASNSEIRFLTITNTGVGYLSAAITNIGAAPKLTRVTATASGGARTNYGIFNYHASSPVIDQVTASASGGGWESYGIFDYEASSIMSNVSASASGAPQPCAIFVYNSSGSMAHVTGTASGGTQTITGIYFLDSSTTVSDVIATALGGYGVQIAGGSSLSIDRSTFEGTVGSIQNNSNNTVRIGSSRLIGGISGSGPFACAASYNANYVSLDPTCH